MHFAQCIHFFLPVLAFHDREKEVHGVQLLLSNNDVEFLYFVHKKIGQFVFDKGMEQVAVFDGSLNAIVYMIQTKMLEAFFQGIQQIERGERMRRQCEAFAYDIFLTPDDMRSSRFHQIDFIVGMA
jgi:hypothetical protein